MSRKVLIVGEGPNELGDSRNWGDQLKPANLPSLARLVHRLLREPSDTVYICKQFKTLGHFRGLGAKYTKTMKTALRLAHRNGYDAVALVIDRDRKGHGDTFTPLAKGRDEVRSGGVHTQCAIGVAVETYDAWMIADPNAIREAGSDPQGHHPSPEGLGGKEGTGNHPKDFAKKVFGDGLSQKYAEVATCIRLEHLAKCCPQGFGAFAEEVKGIALQD